MHSCKELLERMIGFNTVNGIHAGKPYSERELALYLEKVAAGWGLRTRRSPVSGDHFNLFVICEGAPGADWLLFDSHLDTVGLDGMTVDPLVAKCEDGRLFGRGVCDTKGSGAAMLWALRQYAQAPSRELNVGLLFSIDEESDMTGAEAFTRLELPELASKTLGIIVGEPTLMRPVVAHGGMIRGRIVTSGLAAHSSDPNRGKSAISLMAKVVNAFESSYLPTVTARHPLAGKAAASINVIQGGTQVNVIPDRCEILFDRRVMPGEVMDDILPEIEKVLDSVRATQPDARITLESIFNLEPMNPEGRDSFTRFVTGALEQENLDASLTGAPWTTNACHYSRLIPAIILGPGDIAQAHTTDEWLALFQLELATRLYLRLMLQPALEIVNRA